MYATFTQEMRISGAGIKLHMLLIPVLRVDTWPASRSGSFTRRAKNARSH